MAAAHPRHSVVDPSQSHQDRHGEEVMWQRRQGFTLVELLVVIAIIGILVSLLLPAVQAAREAARRMQCSNNLKQIALATHNYADTYRTALPAGSYRCCWGTWLVGLLPYIEQSNLRDQYQFYGWMTDNATNNRYGGALNLPVTRTQLSAYSCPSDSVTASSSVISGVTFHNYVGNYGNTTPERTTPYGVDTAGNPNRYGMAPFARIQSVTSNPQVIRLADMLDGLSNTLLFSETVQGRDGDLRGFAWWQGGCHFETLFTPNSSAPDITEQASYCRPANPLNPPCGPPTSTNLTVIGARSRHPGGVQTAMCDGSVRFVGNPIHLDTWRRLSTAAAQDIVGDF